MSQNCSSTKKKVISGLKIIPRFTFLTLALLSLEIVLLAGHGMRKYVILRTVWHHLYNLKNVKNTHGGVR